LAELGIASDREREWETRIGGLGVRILDSLGFVDVQGLRAKLRVLDRSLEEHAYQQMIGAVAGLLFGLGIVFSATLLELGLPAGVALVLPFALMVGGWLLPNVPLTEQVEARRASFRHGLSAYLDLVTIMLAAGQELGQAMERAAEAGENWTFVEIRHALKRARNTGRDAWDILDELGADLGIEKLRELATSVTLAGKRGATIKTTLATQADSLRATLAAEVEIAAERRTQRMAFPGVLILLGLMAFVGIAALNSIEPASPPPDAPATVTTR
jgi:Flp pilus assembly protein TadB